MKYSGIYTLFALQTFVSMEKIMNIMSESPEQVVTIGMHILQEFIAIHINLFDKTKILAIILKFHQKLWHKKLIFSFFWIFYIFVKIMFENLRLINGHFKTILDHFFWIKSYDTLLGKYFFWNASFVTSEQNQLSYFQNSLYRDVIYLISKLLECKILSMK